MAATLLWRHSKNQRTLGVFIVDLLILIAIVGALLFVRCKPIIWTVIMLVVLGLATYFKLASTALLIPSWVVFLVAAVFVHASPLRRILFTKPAMKIFRKVLPPMSETERAALEAGSVWWEGELFRGKPNWNTLHSYPKPKLTDEEQAFLDIQVEKVCSMLDDFQIVQESDMPESVWKYLKEEGFFGMLIPKSFGGLEFSAYMQSCVVSKIATRSVSAAVTTMVPNSLGPAELLLHYGTEEQKNHFLPRLADGREVPCFALTSTEGGSDAGAMPDSGVVCKGMHEGQEVLGIKLNFDKRYITLAPKATLVGLAFKMYDPEHLLGDTEELGITCALLPHDHPGMQIGDRHYPMYLSFLNGPIRGKDVFIPMDWIIGGQAQAGNGWRMLMECLSAGRGISLPALSTAAGKFNYSMLGAYAKLREQFGISIGKFEGVQDEMAKAAGLGYMLEATRCFTAGAVDLVGKPALASAIAKYHMTEMLRKSSDIAMDVHAGRAIQTGPKNYLANIYLSIPVAITVEGANILTRSLMIFGQGAVRCHPYVFNEMQALMDEDHKRGLKTFDNLLIGHMGYGLSNFVRAICFGLTNARLIKAPKSGPTAKYYRHLTRMSTAVSLISGLSMMSLGGELKRKESLSARLGDVLSYLYMASAVLKYYEDNGCTSDDLTHVDWAVRHCLYEMQEAFYGAFRNFPSRVKGRLFRYIIFPLGRTFKCPSDRLGHRLANLMMTDNSVRRRFNETIWSSMDPEDCTGAVEAAFQKMLAVEPLLKAINKGIRSGKISKKLGKQDRISKAVEVGILKEEEANELREFEALRIAALEVDDFKPEFFEKFRTSKTAEATTSQKEHMTE
jgi:alkylation response protein AidB-like acyl-CoA dehydrogenase